MPAINQAILYYTANVIHDSFATAVRNHITNLAVATNSLLVSVSQKPIDFGLNLCMGEMGWSAWLVYWQILHGARAIQRLKIPWIYCCEDDSLYTEEHLSYVPPDKDKFYYNMNRWIIERYSGGVHYRWRDRISMCSCVVATDLMVATLEARFRKFPEPITTRYDPRLRGWGEPGRYEWYLKLPKVGMEYFSLPSPILTFNHKKGLGGYRKLSKKDIIKETLEPWWGTAQSVWNEYYGH